MALVLVRAMSNVDRQIYLAATAHSWELTVEDSDTQHPNSAQSI